MTALLKRLKRRGDALAWKHRRGLGFIVTLLIILTGWLFFFAPVQDSSRFVVLGSSLMTAGMVGLPLAWYSADRSRRDPRP